MLLKCRWQYTPPRAASQPYWKVWEENKVHLFIWLLRGMFIITAFCDVCENKYSECGARQLLRCNFFSRLIRIPLHWTFPCQEKRDRREWCKWLVRIRRRRIIDVLAGTERSGQNKLSSKNQNKKIKWVFHVFMQIHIINRLIKDAVHARQFKLVFIVWLNVIRFLL